MSRQITISITVPLEETYAVADLLKQLDTPIVIDPPIEGDAPVEDITETEPVKVIYETEILWGINFRNAPNADTETYIWRMLPKGEKIHVIRETGTGWLEIIVQDGTIGFISANSKYTNYSSRTMTDKIGDKIIAHGAKFLGAPYVFGADVGELNEAGVRIFDCSSFTKTVFQEVLSIRLPRVSYNQAKEGSEVAKADLSKGDLVFFTSRSLPIGHVAIYAGNDTLLHTYSPAAGGVKYTGFTGTQWEERFTTARRFF